MVFLHTPENQSGLGSRDYWAVSPTDIYLPLVCLFFLSMPFCRVKPRWESLPGLPVCAGSFPLSVCISVSPWGPSVLALISQHLMNWAWWYMESQHSTGGGRRIKRSRLF